MAREAIIAGKLRAGGRVVQIDGEGIVEIELEATERAVRPGGLDDAFAGLRRADDLVTLTDQVRAPLRP